MPVVFVPKKLTEPAWFMIDLGNGNSIEIAIAKPTLEQQLQAVENARGLSYSAFEISSLIKDWRGVNDADGNPVPYSWGVLNQLCGDYDSAVFEILQAIRKSKRPASEDQLKNLPLTPVVGGTVTVTEIAPSIPSLTSTSESSDYENFEESST